MSEEITLEEYKKAFFEVYKEQRRKSFFLHLTIYILVNTASIIINFLFTPTFLWVIFPIFFWGIGVIWNYLGVFLWIDQKLNETSLKAEYSLKKRRKT
ncbi:MAG: 2TM domain-containing protein [Euryarchaeota archaeon]|nr:2TM domain-containing protein [Euryarchaeota archaeon]